MEDDNVIQSSDIKKSLRFKNMLKVVVVLLLIVPILIFILFTRQRYDLVSAAIIRNVAAEQLNKDPNDLTEQDFVGITKLNLEQKKLSEIKFLEKFVNLQELDMLGVQFIETKSMNPTLKKLLTKLHLIDSQQEKKIDLSPLKQLSHIKTLKLHSASFKDIEFLSNLKNLEYLDLGYANINDIEPIKDLTNLKTLCIFFSKVSDLSPLKDMSKLRVLYLNGTPVSDIKPLDNLGNLEFLFLEDTQITNLESLSRLNKLKSVNFDRTNISNLEPLKNLSSLNRIGIRDCPNITDEQIDDLQKALPNLKINK